MTLGGSNLDVPRVGMGGGGSGGTSKSPMDARPLHVRVAEALGCKPEYGAFVYLGLVDWRCPCRGTNQHWSSETESGALARYDTDWSATGPLIERYGITLVADGGQWTAIEGMQLISSSDYCGGMEAAERTPLLAACHLILSLHAAGKLEPAK